MSDHVRQQEIPKSNELNEIFTRLLKETIEQQARHFASSEASQTVGLNWRNAYLNTVQYILEYSVQMGWPKDIFKYISTQELEDDADSFVQALNNLGSEELLFEDVRDPNKLSELTRLASDLIVWTTGDMSNGNQYSKLNASHIVDKLKAAAALNPSSSTSIDVHVSDQKVASIPDLLDNFVSKRPDAGRIALVLIDDSRSSLNRAVSAVDFWKKKRVSPLDIELILIRSRRGKRADEQWGKLQQLIYEGAEVSDFASLVKKETEGAQISPKDTLILLDFDGTLADNEKMDRMQTELVQSHLLKFFEKQAKILAYDTIGRDEMELEEEFENEENLAIYTRGLLSRILPLWHKEHQINWPSPLLKRLSGEIGYHLEEESHRSLLELDAQYRHSAGLLSWKGLRQRAVEYEASSPLINRIYQCAPWPKHLVQQGKVENPFYFVVRKGLRSNDVQRLRFTLGMDSETRNETRHLANEIEKRINSVCYDADDPRHPRFISGGLKSIDSMLRKVDEMGIENIDEICDMARGMVVAEDLETLFKYTVKLADEFADCTVRFNNFYKTPYLEPETGQPRAYKACRFVFRLNDELTYELQVRTKRSKAAGDLDHETTMKRSVALSSEEEAYIHSLFWTANLLDYEEFLNGKQPQKPAEQPFDPADHVLHPGKYIEQFINNLQHYSTLNLLNPEAVRETIHLFSEKWLNAKPSDIDEETWKKKGAKIVLLIQNAIGRLEGRDRYRHYMTQRKWDNIVDGRMMRQSSREQNWERLRRRDKQIVKLVDSMKKLVIAYDLQ